MSSDDDFERFLRQQRDIERMLKEQRDVERSIREHSEFEKARWQTRAAEIVLSHQRQADEIRRLSSSFGSSALKDIEELGRQQSAFMSSEAMREFRSASEAVSRLRDLTRAGIDSYRQYFQPAIASINTLLSTFQNDSIAALRAISTDPSTLQFHLATKQTLEDIAAITEGFNTEDYAQFASTDWLSLLRPVRADIDRVAATFRNLEDESSEDGADVAAEVRQEPADQDARTLKRAEVLVALNRAYAALIFVLTIYQAYAAWTAPTKEEIADAVAARDRPEIAKQVETQLAESFAAVESMREKIHSSLDFVVTQVTTEAHLRSGPSLQNDVLETLDAGAQFVVTKEVDGWSAGFTVDAWQDRKTGWVKSDFLVPVPAANKETGIRDLDLQ